MSSLADQWYYVHDKNKLGPFSGQQLRDLADAGRIVPSDTIWKEGVGTGMLASKVKHLFAQIQAAPLVSLPVEKAAATTPIEQPTLPLPTADASPAVLPAIDPLGIDNSTSLLALPEGGYTAAKTPGVIPVAGNGATQAEDANAKEEAPPSADTPRPPPKPVKKGRAVAGKGATIISQDGKLVKFKKKCTECGKDDSAYGTMKFTLGSTMVAFFCAKCRKQRHVEIRGYPH